MARISELHYSNSYAARSGISEFLEVSLDPSEDPADFSVAFYQHTGTQGLVVSLDDPGVQVTYDAQSDEYVYVISADDFNIRLTDPNGGGANNYEAYALVNTDTGTVEDFYDIGGGTTAITATNGLAAGATSVNLPVLTGPGNTTTTLQFNAPDVDTLAYEAVNPGDSGIACFAAGTMILTRDGPRRIESLQPGGLVETRDDGMQPVRWIGASTVDGRGDFAPIRIRKGTFGATRDLYVSPQHRMFIEGWRAELLCAEAEVLVAAKHLVNDCTITRAPRRRVTYVHMLFDRHQVVTGNGALSESYFPGPTSLEEIAPACAAEIKTLFPGLRTRAGGYGPMARPQARSHEGALLADMLRARN